MLRLLSHVVKPRGWLLQRGLKGLVVGLPKEQLPGEHRVALAPTSVHKLVGKGVTVQVEAGAGLESGFTDSSYEQAGAKVVEPSVVWKSGVVVKVRPTLSHARISLREPAPSGRDGAIEPRDPSISTG